MKLDRVQVRTDGAWTGVIDWGNGEKNESSVDSPWNIYAAIDKKSLPAVKITVKQVDEENPFVLRVADSAERLHDGAGI